MSEVHNRSWGELLFAGIVALLFGLIAAFWPGKTLLVIIMFFGIFILIEGIITVVMTLIRRKQYKNWWIGLVGGILGILIGGVTVFRPFATTVFLLYMVGIWAFITGVLTIISAIRLRKSIRNEWYLVLSGIVAVIFSLFVFARPVAAAVTMMWIISAFAILFGALLVVLAFRLKRATA
jgi:uncharacterized membrane protein HdeD (DUF308 family)